MAKRSKIQGMDALLGDFKRLGKVPQTVANKSARAGAVPVLKSAKKNAPVDEGNLRSGIVMKRERTKIRGKAVYDVMVDPKKTALFRRETKSGTRRVGGKGENANNRIRGGYYYPASQEYGFMTVDGGYVPGYRYMRRAADDNEAIAKKRMLEEAGKAVDKALRRRSGG